MIHAATLEKRAVERAAADRVLRKAELTTEHTIESIARGALYDPRAFFDKDGNLRPIKDLSEAEAWAIAGFDVCTRNVASGDGHQDTVVKVRFIDRARYVELAAKWLGMLVERVELSASSALLERLDRGRQRLAVTDTCRPADIEVAAVGPTE